MVVSNYETYLALHLNAEWADVADTMNLVNAFRIALGHAKIPPEWYDLLEPDPGKRSQWQGRELLSGDW